MTKTKLFKIFAILVLPLVAFISIFAFTFNTSSKNVYAYEGDYSLYYDMTNTTFTNVGFRYSSLTSTTNWNVLTYNNNSDSFTMYNGRIQFLEGPNGTYTNCEVYFSLGHNTSWYISGAIDCSFNLTSSSTGYNIVMPVKTNTSGNSTSYSAIAISVVPSDKTPTLNMVSLITGSNYDVGYFNPFNIPFFSNINTGYYNYISYLDSAGWRYSIAVPVVYYNYAVGTQYMFFSKYSIVYLGSSQQDVNYTAGYNAGYDVGFSDGESSGYNAGESAGYNSGYTDGLNNGESNNFATVIGAAVDVPVNTFRSLLNFEFLGINLFGFATSILTIVLVVFIVKFIFFRR